MADGILLLDAEGRIKLTNRAAVTILERKQEELINSKFIIPPMDKIMEIEILAGDHKKYLTLNAVKTTLGNETVYLVTLRDITELKITAAKIQNLSIRLVEAQEKERRQIGHDLHDEVGGALTGIKLALTRAQKQLGEKAVHELGYVNELLDETMEMVSTLSHTMRPDILDEFGLAEALDWYIERYTKQTGIRVAFKHNISEARFSSIIESTVYRIIQESLTNVARYAAVKHVSVHLLSRSKKLIIKIEDRGKGFDFEQVKPTSSGISGMQDRAFLVGGNLEVNSSPGKGTSVNCELPL